MDYRIEKDSMGEVKVAKDKLWKAQTQRSVNNFHIGKEKMPLELIHSIVVLKKAIALVHCDNDKMSKEKTKSIVYACDQILESKFDDQFPLSVWQTGSGTQSNMNINEVISSIANMEFDTKVHPNDDVNKSQSTNDVFPSGMHIASYIMIKDKLLPALDRLLDSFKEFYLGLDDIIKVGRTHLQDATPLRVNQEISGWIYTLEKAKEQLELNLGQLRHLAIGGSAVGTGINTYENFASMVVDKLNQLTGKDFEPSANKFYSLSSKNEMLVVHSILNALAMELLRIGNDIRWLSSGPRAGIGEYIIPSNEPGSSIMPGKVNPTQVEALSMVCAQVFGNQTSISFAASQGNFQLNVYMPLIAYNMLQSIELLSDMMDSFDKNLVKGISIDRDVIESNLKNSLMTVTALNPYIGYDNSARLAKFAHENGMNLYEANEQLKILAQEDLIKYLDPKKMV